MVKIPFHRKVLPWMFTLIFLIMAPALVFYTSGYRWNPKKHAIERNGTLIIDTSPTGASIKLNGKSIPETTSVTLQNMAPGNYDIELDLKGYHPWSKTLSIDPERVTFASNIILWPDQEPQLVSNVKTIKLFSDADSGIALAVSQDATSTLIGVIDQKTNLITSQVSIKEVISVNSIELNPQNDTQALVYGQSASSSSLWLVQFSPPSATKLPEGYYHWQSGGLIGQTDGTQLTIKSDQSVTREQKAPGLKDVLDNWRLKIMPQASDLILTQGDNAKQGLILPPGGWQFWMLKKGSLILRDKNRWVWIDTTQSPTVSRQATGDWLAPITYKRALQFVIKNNNEVWIWKLGEEAELIYRQSDPIVSVSWHPAGNDIMVATQKDVSMFSLDARNVRNQTTLATFDEVTDAVIADTNLYIAGTRAGQTGLWRLPVTLKSSSFFSLGLN
ncbi:MAG: PEGA domain-containing protein [Patescibacteria group bacterium]|jgi:hypothetical protein